MKKFPRLLTTCLLLALGACTPRKPGSQIWMYTTDFDRNKGRDSVLTNASFLDLQPDGRFTRDFARFEYGTWELKGMQLLLTDQYHKTYVYPVDSLDAKRLFLQLGTPDRVGGFRGLGPAPGSPEKDPFSVTNNKWRIPPANRESDDGIRRRLLDHCRFWEIYLTWAADADIDEVEVRNIPSSIKVHANGFGLKRYDDLSAEWRSFFYDERDCHRADSLMRNAFRTHNLTWPKTDDDMKRLISGFHQIQQWLQ